MINTLCGSFSSLDTSAKRDEPMPGTVAPDLGVFLFLGISNGGGQICALCSVAKSGRKSP
jgi:hypothetical protein